MEAHSAPVSMHELCLLTDLYQLTMASGYFADGRCDDEAVFQLFFRKHPFAGGYTIAAGLEPVVEFIKSFGFDDESLGYLATLTGNDGQALFDKPFLDYLADMQLCCDIDAVPEGSVVFPHEPLLRVRGPLIQAQLLETTLLNIMNFQSLVATKAARICRAAGNDPVLEFGLRRAQGIDGGLAASRAAYIGGCAASSNVLAGKRFGIPVKGTHAHSWVMSYADEEEAFSRYADAMPNNCVFLVDTYDTVEGVKKAISVGLRLRQQGHEMVGIRLDSGDLTWLSKQARHLLDAAGFQNAAIVASNDLDEHIISSLKAQGACITIWGVGTKLATAYDQPALGGVYKLSAIKRAGQDWRPVVKLSEQAIKVSNPGLVNVRRYHLQGSYRCDVLYDEMQGLPADPVLVDPQDATRQRTPPADATGEDLLQPVFKAGACVAELPELAAIRQRTGVELQRFYEGCLRLDNPHTYPVGLEAGLHKLKTNLIKDARQCTV